MDFAEIYVGALLYQADVERIFGKIVDIEEYGEDIEKTLSKTPLIRNSRLEVRYLSECYTEGKEKLHKDETYVVVLGKSILHIEPVYRSLVRDASCIATDIPKAIKEVSEIFSRYRIGMPVKVYSLGVDN